jgi:predicted nucleotidyltransferase
MAQMKSFRRQTNDLDISVALSLDELPIELGKLFGWRRHPAFEHGWRSPTGLKVDVIPAAPELLAAGRIHWPGGHTMSLLGFRHAFERPRAIQVTAALRVNAATVTAIALMKMAAYQERPDRRLRDLGDLAHILEHYADDAEERRFSDEVLAAGITYEQVGAFLLGRDLAEMVDLEERRIVERFLGMLGGEIDSGRTEALMLQQAPPAWRTDPEEMPGKARALALGLERAPYPPTFP